MTENQEHFGRKFYQDKKTGYWISSDYSKNQSRIRAHRWVWLHIYKVIPKGYHIHHINNDKSDNRIENLELMQGSRHLRYHMQDPVRKQRARELAEKYRPLTKEWHASEEGRAWHKLHALKFNFGNGPLHKYECKQCTKEYFSKLKAKNRSLFCSNACKSKWRRENKLDDVDKTCPVCKSIYSSSRYSRSKTCGVECGRKIKQ